jgi:tetratricopeptide (TPR) repeat protein
MLVWLWSACAAGQTAPTTALAEPTEPARLTAESLRHSAIVMLHSPGAPGRTGRLVALARLADRVLPGHAETNWLLADIYESQGRLESAAQAAEVCLKADPRNHQMGRLWLNLRIAMLQDADRRVAFLEGILSRADLPGALRAEAAAGLAGLFRGRGEPDHADRAVARALELDGGNPAAIDAELARETKPSPVRRVKALLARLRSNPRATSACRGLAAILGELGLHGEAMELFDFAWEVRQQTQRDALQDPAFVAAYCNAVLDGGRPQKLIDRLAEVLGRRGVPSDVCLPLIEAHRAVGDEEGAGRLIRRMESALMRRKAAASISPTFARELATFYLLVRPQYQEALSYARAAERIESGDLVTQRLLGIAELKTGAVESGVRRLEQLAERDVYAAAFLAEHYFAAGDAATAKKHILTGAGLTRSGPAPRRLLAIAAHQKVPIPAPQEAHDVRRLWQEFDKRYLKMGRQPETFLRVALRAVRETVAVGEPIEVEAVLTNIGSLEVPLGEWGLLRATMALEVTLADRRRKFSDLPMLTWPAPRYLPPSKSVRTRVRLDVGRLGTFLTVRPLEDMKLTVSALLDPMQGPGRRLVSSLPTVDVPPASITRKDILGSFGRTDPQQWPKAYERSLGYIVRDMTRGRLAERMRAARQVGALLAAVAEVELRRVPPPEHLAETFSRPVLLRMLQEVMKDQSAAVRAEMLASLHGAKLDALALQLIGGAVRDDSPLVRFRIAELVGASRPEGWQTTIDYLSADADEFVRQMAATFQRATERKFPTQPSR